MEQQLLFGDYCFGIDPEKKIFNYLANRVMQDRPFCTYGGSCILRITLECIVAREWCNFSEQDGKYVHEEFQNIQMNIQRFKIVISKILKKEGGAEFIEELMNAIKNDQQFLAMICSVIDNN